DQCRTSRRRSRRRRNGSGAPRTGHAPWRAPGSSGTRSPRTARRSDGGGVRGVTPFARRPVASAGQRRRATSGVGRGGRHRPAVPEVVEAVVRRVPDLERLARAAGGDVLPVVLPDLRDRALVAGELLLVRRAGARAEEATRRAELGVVPDLAETARAGSAACRTRRAAWRRARPGSSRGRSRAFRAGGTARSSPAAHRRSRPRAPRGPRTRAARRALRRTGS